MNISFSVMQVHNVDLLFFRPGDEYLTVHSDYFLYNTHVIEHVVEVLCEPTSN